MAAYWLGLSGYFKPMLLTLGAISIVLVIGLCMRMKILDRETVPYLTLLQTISYFAWLGREIIKANVAVVRTVLRPDMEITPKLIKVPTPNPSDIGKTMFANSITLTPGTVSVDIDENHILVHALISEMANPADFKDMGERAGWAVGELPGGQS